MGDVQSNVQYKKNVQYMSLLKLQQQQQQQQQKKKQ
jgi:hypothetical protein